MDLDPYSPVSAVCLSLITLEVASGIFINLFILVVILPKVCQEKSNHSGDVLQAAMSRSSIVLTLLLVSSFYCFIFFSKVFNTFQILFNFLIIYSISSSLYLTGLFCFFLFIKIVQFQSGVIVWLKRKVVLVPRLVVAVEVFSFCSGFLSFASPMVTDESYTNSSVVSSPYDYRERSLDLHVSFIVLAVLLVPYILMAMTTITAAGSLLLHGQKMKNMKNNGAVNTETYQSTAYKMMAFFMSHTLFCGLLFVSYFAGPVTSTWFWAILIIMFSLPTANSLILIYSNTRLRNDWKRMTGWIFCCKSSVQAENS